MIVGDHAQVTRRFGAADVADFTALMGQAGPSSPKPADMVPEPLIGALFSYLLGVELPGFGTNYLKQSLHFHAPAPLDAWLTARVQITRLRPEKRLVDLATTCHAADGTLICDGRALVLAPSG